MAAGPVATNLTGSAQEVAVRKASYAAARGIRGHVGGGFGGGSFEGVGWSTTPNVPTCTPGPGRQLIGDSGPILGRGGYYRCRIWR